jgi:biopolymer transport protein ExbD
MTWSIRHEGSPRALEGLSLAQVVEGLQDGLWEVTDEVMGPGDQQWVAIESHPQLAEVALDLEPPPKHPEDETRLDMNPLIDVALVLLIFFILTTTYAALQKYLDMPSSDPVKAEGKLRQVSAEKVKEIMIKVQARHRDGKTILRVEDETVDEANLLAALSRYASTTKKNELLIDASDDVDWGTVSMIQDTAKGAGFQRVIFPVQATEAAKGADKR